MTKMVMIMTIQLIPMFLILISQDLQWKQQLLILLLLQDLQWLRLLFNSKIVIQRKTETLVVYSESLN